MTKIALSGIKFLVRIPLNYIALALFIRLVLSDAFSGEHGILFLASFVAALWSFGFGLLLDAIVAQMKKSSELIRLRIIGRASIVGHFFSTVFLLLPLSYFPETSPLLDNFTALSFLGLYLLSGLTNGLVSIDFSGEEKKSPLA